MTRIVFFKKNNQFVGYEVSGHAHFAEYGEDIVCAAISILTWQVYNSMKELSTDDIILMEDEKEALVQCQLNTISYETTILMKSYYLSLRHLAQVYPNYISLKIEEVE